MSSHRKRRPSEPCQPLTPTLMLTHKATADTTNLYVASQPRPVPAKLAVSLQQETHSCLTYGSSEYSDGDTESLLSGVLSICSWLPPGGTGCQPTGRKGEESWETRERKWVRRDRWERRGEHTGHPLPACLTQCPGSPDTPTPIWVSSSSPRLRAEGAAVPLFPGVTRFALGLD